MSNFKVFVDWNEDGDYSDSNEDITNDIYSLEWSLGRTTYNSIFNEARLTAVLDNIDKKYSPEYSSSPLFGVLLPGRRIKVEDGDSNIMFLGVIRDISPEPIAIHGQKVATITATMARPYLQKFVPRVDLFENVTVDVIIRDLLDQFNNPIIKDVWKMELAGFSELGSTTILGEGNNYNFDVGETTITYFGDNLDDKNNSKQFLEIVAELINAERGYFWQDRDGTFVFRNRNHYNLSSYTPDYTYDDDVAALTYEPPGHKFLINDIELTVYPRVEGSSETLWQKQSDITIEPGETLDLKTPYTDTTNTLVGGKDIAEPTPTFTSGTASIDQFIANGQYANIRMVNDGSVDAVIDDLSIAGNPITSNNPVIIKISNDTSIASYGQRFANYDLKAIDNVTDGKNIANYELLIRSKMVGIITEFEIEAEADGTDNADLINTTFDTLVRLVDSQTGHDRTYFVIGESHSINSFNTHTARFTLEPTPIDEGFWILGTSELGITTGVGY